MTGTAHVFTNPLQHEHSVGAFDDEGDPTPGAAEATNSCQRDNAKASEKRGEQRRQTEVARLMQYERRLRQHMSCIRTAMPHIALARCQLLCICNWKRLARSSSLWP